MEANLALFLVIYTSLFLLLIFSGIPIAYGLGLLGIVTLGIFTGWDKTKMISYLAWNSTTMYSLTAIMPFTLMGCIFAHSGLAMRIFSSLSPLMCRLLPGGLLHANVVAGALFAASSGSSIATTTTLGLISLAELERRGYDRRLSIGSVISGGSLGILIPPSITMIIYGGITNNSIGELFIAGVIPGIILTMLYMSYIAIRLKLTPSLATPGEEVPFKIAIVQALEAWPLLLLIVVVIGSIYLGVATATEAGSMGCVLTVMIAAAYRLLCWEVIKKSTWDAVRVQGVLLLLFTLARVVGCSVALLEVPNMLMEFIVSLKLNPYLILASIFLIYIGLGMIMESLTSIIMTLAITYPVVTGLGFDPIWYGVALVLLDECGLLSPPFGLSLFVIQGLFPKYKFSDIYKAAIPFCLIILFLLTLLTVFPKLATFLPGMMHR